MSFLQYLILTKRKVLLPGLLDTRLLHDTRTPPPHRATRVVKREGHFYLATSPYSLILGLYDFGLVHIIFIKIILEVAGSNLPVHSALFQWPKTVPTKAYTKFQYFMTWSVFSSGHNTLNAKRSIVCLYFQPLATTPSNGPRTVKRVNEMSHQRLG